MLVYRVEHKKSGCGPYSPQSDIACTKLTYRLCNAHSDNEHPDVYTAFETISADDIIKNEYIFACSSLEQLHAWFDGFMEDLIACGYEIAVYDVEDVYIGKNQIVFNRMLAQRIVC